VEGFQESLADLKSRLASAMSEKDRYFQEKLDLNQKVQQLLLEKETLLKVSINLWCRRVQVLAGFGLVVRAACWHAGDPG
jgi:hypothetical protein